MNFVNVHHLHHRLRCLYRLIYVTWRRPLAGIKKLQQHFTQKQHAIQKFSSFLARKVNENVLLQVQDIVLFQTQHKTAFAIDVHSKKFLVDKNLGELQEMLDPKTFFRANHEFLVNINHIKSYKTYERVKLLVTPSIPGTGNAIIVNPESAGLFKKWIAGE